MLILALSAAFAADPIPTGRIDHVVVFPDRASVTRVIEVDLVPGLNEIEFRDLPPTIDERTFQAEGAGPEGTKLAGIEIVSRELAEDRRERVSSLEQQIRDLDDQIRADNDRADAARVELQFLRALQAAAAQQTSNQLLFAKDTPQQALSLADMLEKRVPEVMERIRLAENAARDKGAKRDALGRELMTVQGATQWARRDVKVALDASKAGPATVSLTYVLPGASWTPAYDFRAHPDTGKVDVGMNALVVQVSGEDWSGVGLELSTARPSEGISPPGLDPFWLAPPQPVYSSYYDYGDSAGAVSMDEDDAERAPSPKPAMDAPEPPPRVAMTVVAAQVQERAVATTFEVPGRTAIPGDGTRRKVHVADVPLTVTFVHVAVPRWDPSAWLTAHAEWTQSWPLLPGEAASFVDDAFVGTSAVPLIGTGAEVELPFGRDDSVIVENKPQREFTSSIGFGRERVELAWDYRVKNARKAAISVELRDRLPQSTTAKYKVVPDGDVPEEATADGLLTWTRALQPGAETTVHFAYDVTYPKKLRPGSVQ